jgi:prepilin-type processing-associated H-X9-DG protein
MGQEFGAPPKRGIPALAWLIIVPCGCLILLIPVCAILAAILFPVFSQARAAARQVSCLSNVKQQALGTIMYVQDYDETFPPSNTWVDATFPYVKNDKVYRCPEVPAGSSNAYGYAFNSALSRKLLKKVSVPATTQMMYDSTNLSKNATDAMATLPNPPRHRNRGNNIGYVDGHARSTATPLPTGP